MTIQISIPENLMARLKEVHGEDLSRAALESLAIDGYRRGQLSHFELQQILGFETRWDADRFLADHRVDMGYSVADLDADRRTLDKLLGK